MSAISLSTSEIYANWGEPDKAPAFSKQRLVVWKQLQTNIFLPPVYFFGALPNWQSVRCSSNTTVLGSPATVRQMVTPWRVFFFFLCRWLHHRRHRVLLERRRNGRDGGDKDWVASVLHRRLQAGVAERCVFHRWAQAGVCQSISWIASW